MVCSWPKRSVHKQRSWDMSNAKALLVIAYGNSLRRDDGAGLAFAERLVAQWQSEGIALQHIALHQLTPELALIISDPAVERVLFVDTAENGKEKIILQPLLHGEASHLIGHHMTPESLLLYAERLYHHCPSAWLLTIPGSDFGFGEGFSERTAKHLGYAPVIAGALLRKMMA